MAKVMPHSYTLPLCTFYHTGLADSPNSEDICHNSTDIETENKE